MNSEPQRSPQTRRKSKLSDFQLLSPKTFKIMLLFLGIPFLLGVGWLAIPFEYKPTFILVEVIYYIWYFFAWMTFYDFIWPNCPKRFLFLGCLLFSLFTTGGFIIIWRKDLWHERLAFSILHGAEAIASTTCYVLHIFYARKQIRAQNRRISMLMGDKSKITEEDLFHLTITGPRIHRHWSRSLYMPLCYLKGVDGVEEEEQATKTEDLELHEHQTDSDSKLQMSKTEYNAPEYNQEDDIENNNNSVDVRINRLRLHGFQQWSLSTLIFALLFKLLMVGSWYYLQGFIIIARRWGTDTGENTGKRSFIVANVSKAVAAVAIFQVTRAILTNVLIVVNLKMPEFLESSYFSQFAVQTLFFFYYRNLFLSVSDWSTTIAVNIVSWIFQVILFPLYMTRTAYNFRFDTMRRFVKEKATFLSFLLPLFEDPNMTYEKHVRHLVVEYYYNMIADYYSVITFIIFLVLIKYGYTWNLQFFNSFSHLKQSQFLQLLYRYLFQFGFETVGDLVIRFGGLRFLNINISNAGRNATILNFRTRYLFTVFMIYFVTDTYYAIISGNAFTID